jgi:hypothetical protein
VSQFKYLGPPITNQNLVQEEIKSSVGSSHMVVWQPRTMRWSRHTDNVAGSRDAKPKKEAMRQLDNSISCVQFLVRCVLTNKQCINNKESVNVGEVSAHRYFFPYWWPRRDLNNTQPSDRRDLNSTQPSDRSTTTTTTTVVQNRRCSHCITDDTATGRNVSPSPAPSTCRQTSTTDVNSGARHHYSYRPHLHHLPVK